METLKKSGSSGIRITQEIKQPLSAVSMLADHAIDDLKEAAGQE